MTSKIQSTRITHKSQKDNINNLITHTDYGENRSVILKECDPKKLTTTTIQSEPYAKNLQNNKGNKKMQKLTKGKSKQETNKCILTTHHTHIRLSITQ